MTSAPAVRDDTERANRTPQLESTKTTSSKRENMSSSYKRENMSSSEQSVVQTEFSAGKVQARVLVSAKRARVWEAITRRDVVSMWFGDLSGDIAERENFRLDFGDGDFFTIEGVHIDAQNKVEYSWRFRGTGPRDNIAWTLVDKGENCLLTVTDQEPSRSEETCVELAEGWTDFLERLERYLRTGNLTRYDWCHDFEGCIELPVSAAEAVRALTPDAGHLLWIPIEDALRGERCRINNLQSKPGGLRFQLANDSWKQATTCNFEIVARPNLASAMVVQHTGWALISDDPLLCMFERRRFSEKWIAMLKEARELVARPASPTIQ